MRHKGLLAAAVLALASASGCRNPFEPSADIELVALEWNNGPNSVILVGQTDAAATPLNLNIWRARARVVVRNKVDVLISSASITYTDYDGNEVTAYRNIGGRVLKFTQWCRGVTDNSEFSDGDGEVEGRQTTIDMYIVDNVVIQELRSPAYPTNGFMFAHVVLRGEDVNGYDVRLEGMITIQLLD